MLCGVRFAVKSDHDEIESASVDEPDCGGRGCHWELYGSGKGGLVTIVGETHSLALSEYLMLSPSRSLLRLLLGIVMAGLWPGMAYYLSLFYPPTRTGKRIGFYFTAAQVSAAVVGLVSAGFQKMDGAQGIVGFRWMFLVYGLCGTITGIALLWWLPERPHPPGAEGHEPSEAEGRQKEKTSGYHKLLRWLPQTPPALIGRDAELHYYDLKRVYHRTRWQLSDLIRVLLDWRLWPLLIMYFGVVGVGIGVQSYGTVIIRSTNPQLTSVQLSLLFAPIWIVRILLLCNTNRTNSHDDRLISSPFL